MAARKSEIINLCLQVVELRIRLVGGGSAMYIHLMESALHIADGRGVYELLIMTVLDADVFWARRANGIACLCQRIAKLLGVERLEQKV